MIRAGLILPIRGNWIGGLNYFHSLLRGYQQFPDAALKLDVFTDSVADLKRYECDAIELHACPDSRLMPIRQPKNLPRRLLNGTLGYDPILLRAVQRFPIDLLTHNGLGRQALLPTLHWQPDFQHRVLPELFSRRELDRRDTVINYLATWRNLLVSSYAAAANFRQFYPTLSSVQTHVLHFFSGEILNSRPMPRADLDALYPTKDPYVFLPNQFWQHKNHGVVIAALREAPAYVRVLCTGVMDDPRDPTYMPSLIEKAEKAGVSERFVRLGKVPYPVLVSLMHHAIAVLQPSLFEGWSTTVEEAKAMQKRVLLSSIDTHLEQAPARGLFFQPNSAGELASCLKQAYAEYDPHTEDTFAASRDRYKADHESGWILKFADIVKQVYRSSPVIAGR